MSRGTAARFPPQLQEIADGISKQGGTPLAVVLNERPLGIIYLKDIVKGGMRERFDHLRAMGIKTVMITGDNPLDRRRHCPGSGCG